MTGQAGVVPKTGSGVNARSRPPATGQVIVGWTDSPDADNAVAWAAHHAARTGRSLLIVHESVVDPLSGAAGAVGPGTPGGVEEFAALLAVGEALTERFPGLGIQVSVDQDTVAAGLVRSSGHADILVLGMPDPPRSALMGTIVDHLSAVSVAPVARIPASFTPADETAAGPVLVGLSQTQAGWAAMEFAAAEARLMNAPLLVLATAATRVDPRLTDIVAAQRIRPHIQDSADDVDQAADELCRTAATASLVVVGCHHSTDTWSVRLGPFAGLVAHRVTRPLVTVARKRRPVGHPGQ